MFKQPHIVLEHCLLSDVLQRTPSPYSGFDDLRVGLQDEVSVGIERLVSEFCKRAGIDEKDIDLITWTCSVRIDLRLQHGTNLPVIPEQKLVGEDAFIRYHDTRKECGQPFERISFDASDEAGHRHSRAVELHPMQIEYSDSEDYKERAKP